MSSRRGKNQARACCLQTGCLRRLADMGLRHYESGKIRLDIIAVIHIFFSFILWHRGAHLRFRIETLPHVKLGLDDVGDSCGFRNASINGLLLLFLFCQTSWRRDQPIPKSINNSKNLSLAFLWKGTCLRLFQPLFFKRFAFRIFCFEEITSQADDERR